MFTKYFNLSEQPFGSTPDPRFLFHSNSHREALASLYCAFYANRGFTALIAEPGMGKTTLLFEFLERMHGCAKTVFLFNTFCGPDDIVAYILRDSGIAPGPTVADRYLQLNDTLGAEAQMGRPVILVVDEAQNLSPHTLEGIRMLTNFETSRSKLIQVILAGQPQLAQMLARPELAQLRQRISTICRIEPFTAAEARSYIQHRLQFTGYKGDELFSPAAFDRISNASAGIPRVINTLCFNALCLCRARGVTQVDESMVNEALEDLRLPDCQTPSLEVPSDAPTLACVSTPERRSTFGRGLLALASVLLVVTAGALLVPGLQVGYELRSTVSRAISMVLTKEAPSRSTQKQLLSPPEQAENTRGPDLAASREDSRKYDVGPISVRVSDGDTLTGILTSHLGIFNTTLLHKMQELNPKLTDPNHIETGQTIRLPGLAPKTMRMAATRN